MSGGSGGGRQALPSSLPLPLRLSSSLFPPVTGKVNLFIQSQQGALDTPTQLRSLSTHPCQGESSPLELRHAHACTRTFTPAYQDIIIPNSNTSPTPQPPPSPPHPSLCSKGQSSSDGGGRGGGHTRSQILIIFIIF